MENSLAYEMGRLAGPFVFGILFSIGFLAYSFFLWKYATKRSAVWLVFSIFFGLPFIGTALLFFGVGTFALVARNEQRTSEVEAAGGSQNVLKEKFDTLKGDQFDYTIEVPDLPSWKVDTTMGNFDKVLYNRGIYFGVLPEHIGVGDTDTLRQAAEKNLVSATDSHSIGKAKNTTIAGLPWKTFDADAEVGKLKLRYRFYVFSDSRRAVQIISWSSPELMDKNAYLIDQIAHSFRFGTE